MIRHLLADQMSSRKQKSFTSLSGGSFKKQVIQEAVPIRAAVVTDLDVPLLVIRQQSMSGRIAQPKG